MPTLASLTPLAIVAAVIVATVVGLRLAGRVQETRAAVFPALVDTIGVGLLTARIGYIVQWWPQYASEPWSMVRIGDGGFLAWIGVPCALLFVVWRLWRTPALRRALVGALVAGAITWSGAMLLLRVDAPPDRMPDLVLTTIDGRAVALTQLAGRPVVLNLWATWCPPCRREMPALIQAQALRPDITFILVNQGEQAAEVIDYFDAAKLPSDAVLLDADSTVSSALGVRGYPATVFYAADGTRIDSHAGELTRGALAGKLQSLWPAR